MNGQVVASVYMIQKHVSHSPLFLARNIPCLIQFLPKYPVTQKPLIGPQSALLWMVISPAVRINRTFKTRGKFT